MRTKYLQAGMLTAAICGLGASPALAMTSVDGVDTPTPYVAAFTTAFAPFKVPFSGDMRLVVKNGRVSGTYTGTSVRPDFLNDCIEPVIGTVDRNDGHVQFDVGNALSFNGTMYPDGTISGTADYRGELYDFMAKPR
jgi:hypothetical protein